MAIFAMIELFIAIVYMALNGQKIVETLDINKDENGKHS